MEASKLGFIVGLVMFIGGLIGFFAIGMSGVSEPGRLGVGWATSAMIAGLISAIGFFMIFIAALYHFVFKRK